MSIVCTKVNSLAVPYGVQEFLTRYGGINVNGEPNFRIVWSGNHSVKRTKRFIDTDQYGDVVRQAVETREVLKYAQPMMRDRFIVEMWHPAEEYGDPDQWQRTNTLMMGGTLVQPIGDYPSRGEYEYVDTVESVDASGYRRFAWPTKDYVRAVVDTVRYMKGLTKEQIASGLEDNDLRSELARENRILDQVKNASRPFGGIQPFVSMAGLSAPN